MQPHIKKIHIFVKLICFQLCIKDKNVKHKSAISKSHKGIVTTDYRFYYDQNMI